MTLFVVLGLVAVVIGVLVAIALGVRSMRAQERAGDDWDSPDTDSEFDHPGELGEPVRRKGDPRHQGARRAGSRSRFDDRDDAAGERAYQGRSRGGPDFAAEPALGDGGGPRDGRSAGRRHPQKEQPGKRARPARGAEGWNDTNWERVSDEDYWAEMSADKPLASRTAQSAADLRSPDPVPEKHERDARTDPNLAQPEPQTATMAAPEFSAGFPPGAEQATREISASHDVPSLPVRRSGSTPAHGFAVPATTRPAPRAAAADYTDPNLALLASLGEPAADGLTGRPNRRRPAALEPPAQAAPATPAGGWPAAGTGDWPARGQEPAAAAGYHSAPPAAPAHGAAYGGPAYGGRQPGGYATDTPGYGISASPGHPPANSYDTGSTPAVPVQAAPAVPAAHTASASSASPGPASYGGSGSYGSAYGPGSYGSAYGTGPYGTGSHGSAYGHADVTLPTNSYGGAPAAEVYGTSSGTGSFSNAGPGSYGAAGPVAYGGTPQATGSHAAPPHGGGSYPDPYGAGSSQPAAGGGWGPPAVSGGPGGAPVTGYGAPGVDGYPGAMPAAAAPSTPAGGTPYVQGNTTEGYPSPPPGGFASGYLSSSALSARQRRSEPEPLTSPNSANPYGSYISDPPSAPDDRANSTATRRRPRHRSPAAYDDRHSYGGYGEYGGGSPR